MLNRGSLYVGMLLVLLGAVLIVIQAAESLFPLVGISLGWADLWPLLVLYVASAFWLALLLWWPQRRKLAGLVVPGTIIGVNGLILLYQSLTGDWGSWVYLWALEPVSVGVSLLILYWLLGGRGLLIAAGILAGVGLVFLVLFGSIVGAFRLLGPALLVVLGLVVIIYSVRGRQSARPPEE